MFMILVIFQDSQRSPENIFW